MEPDASKLFVFFVTDFAHEKLKISVRAMKFLFGTSAFIHIIFTTMNKIL